MDRFIRTPGISDRLRRNLRYPIGSILPHCHREVPNLTGDRILGRAIHLELKDPEFDAPLEFAARTHRAQVRKGGDIPYVGHLLGVAATVIEAGGDENQAIAALLHDAAEDQGGKPMLDQICALFGSDVAQIVEGCTDTLDRKRYKSQQRKELYLKHLEAASPGVLLVSLADKLFNARAVMLDLRRFGPSVWDRFNTGVGSQLKFYRALVGVFRSKGDIVPQYLVDEFDRVVRQIEQLPGDAGPDLGAGWRGPNTPTR